MRPRLDKTLIPLVCFVGLTGLGGVGCGDDSGKGPDPENDAGPGVDVQVEGYRCVKDRGLIMTRTECRLDVHCPCGAHCERGLCRHDCIDHSDCLDGWCDFLGYCRGAEESKSLRDVSSPEPSQFLISPMSMAVYDWNLEAPKSVTLYAPRVELRDVRLVASPGLSVRCESDYVEECVIPLVGSGEKVQVSLKVTRSSGEERQVWTLKVHMRNQIEVLGLHKERPPVVNDIEPGVYQGRVWMSQAHSTLTTSQPLESEGVDAPLRVLDLPLVAKVYPDGTFLLSEATGALPQDWVFRIQADDTFDAMDGSEDLSRTVYLGGATTVTPSTTEITVAGSGVIHGREGSLRGTLNLRFGGMGLLYIPSTMVEETQMSSWGFALARVSDIPAEIGRAHV